MSVQNNFRFYLSIFLSLLIANGNVSAKPHGHSHILPTGEVWGNWNKCPPDSFVTGISLKLHVDSDISTITGVRLFCTRQHVLSEGRKDFIDTILQVDPEGQSSHWVKPAFCENGVATEFKVKHADLNGRKTVTNLRIICSDGEILKIHGHGIGKDHGVWTDGLKCSPRHAICGLETQVFPSNGNNIFTDARVHCCDVMNPAIKCIPSERWQLVTECENSEALVPETCGFEKRVGTSYAGKEKETSIYENLGFTLNGVSTDLSSKPEFQSGVVSDATKYEWATAGHDTWMPEAKAHDEIQAPPGHKSSIYQIVGHCGFYRIRSSQFKAESSLVTKSDATKPEHSNGEHKNKHAHVGKHHEHHKHDSNDEHDPNIQADFGDDDSWESDDWDAEEQVDETGKHEPEPVKTEPVKEHKEEKQNEEKTLNESFGDWDESSEEKKSTHVDIPVVEDKVKPNVEEKDSNESDDEWASSEDTKPEAKPEIPTQVAPKADSTEKKDDSQASPAVVSETHDKPEEGVHNSFGDDDWSSSKSEEDKPIVKVDQPAPVAPAKPEDTKSLIEKKESAEAIGNEWDSSEETKPEKHEDVAPIAPTSDSKIEETKGAVEKKDSEEDFSEDDWAHSEEKKPEVKEEAQETKVNNLPLHEPISVDSKNSKKQAADDSFSDDWDVSEEKTHEAKVVHANEEHSKHKPEVKEESAEDNTGKKEPEVKKEEAAEDNTGKKEPEVKKEEAAEDNTGKKEPEVSKKPEVVKTEVDSKQPLTHDDDMELMAKDTPSDEWTSFEDSEEVKPQEKPPNKAVPPQHEHVHHGHHVHHGDAEIHQAHMPSHQNENIKMPETAAQVSDDDDYWDDDDFVVEIPETRFDKMEKQQEHQEPEDHSDTESLKFPDFKKTFDTAGEKVQETVAPLTDQIVSAIDDIGKAVQDAKDSPMIKDIQQTLSEVMDAAINPPHDEQQAHQDDEIIPKLEDATQGIFSNETSQEPQKAQSAILGYIVGGMVAGVVIIVIVIFVLERRQPKNRPDETEKEGGGVRDQPLLGGYKKDVALAVGTNDKDAF